MLSNLKYLKTNLLLFVEIGASLSTIAVLILSYAGVSPMLIKWYANYLISMDDVHTCI